MNYEKVDMDITISDDGEEPVTDLFEKLRQLQAELPEADNPLVSEPFIWTEKEGKRKL